MNKLFRYLSILFLIQSCSQSVSVPTPAPIVEVPEIAECATSTAYTSPVTMTGTATFYKRGLDVNITGSPLDKITLSTPISTALPIRYAEVQVKNAAGTIVQCGKTNSIGALKALDGTSSLTIPNTPGTYTVEVLSRSNHSMTVPSGKSPFQFYVSIKTDFIYHTLYSASQSVSSSGTGSVSATLVAYARESESAVVNGGAFNIYNNLITTYEYLAQNTALSDLTCLNPKLEVYWKLGFNPYQYVEPNESPSTLYTASFYDPAGNDLYVNGGKLGNVLTEDTDHFDDTVVIHELGHHIETLCSTADSPGGSHFGLYRTDARLAWSEGWGNFFGTHILKNNLSSLNPDLSAQVAGIGGWLYYLDTMGYTDASTPAATGDEYIRLNLSKAGNNPESIDMGSGNYLYYDKVNPSTHPGEGHFRETSIARSLFKVTNSCASTCSNTDYFSSMWKAYEADTTTGMGSTLYPFRSSARFYNRLNAVFSGSMPAPIDAILNSDEAQQRESNSAYTVGGYRMHVPYGIKLVPSGSACNLKIQPRQDSWLDSNSESDQRYSNHFYTINRADLPGASEIRMTVTKVAGTSVDIDLVLYTQNYSFVEDCIYNSSGVCTSADKVISTDMVRYDRTAGNATTKKIQTLSSLSSTANYLLNIHAYTKFQTISATTEYSYTLTDQSGGYLCPASTF